MQKCWEDERHIEVVGTKNTLRYYKEAGRLSISKPNWQDKDGNTKPGKTVALDIDALREESDDLKAAACQIFRAILDTLEG